MLTEKGYSATGLDDILRQAGVPKGSFYHFFHNKEAFGQTLMSAYASYFAARLDRCFNNAAHPPLQRIQHFVDDAVTGMAKYEFRRGCLVGNLGQEMATLPESFRQQLITIFTDWQQRLQRCLEEAKTLGHIPSHSDCEQLAAFFWTGWEGAVLRAKLEQQPKPLHTFASGFFQLINNTPR